MNRTMKVLVVSLVLASSIPVAGAQGVSLGQTNQRSTQIAPIGGTYYYPGFGFSSRPLNTYGPYYGGYPVAPFVGAPVAVPGLSGYFRFGNARMQYWQAPSGYYYPWGVGAVYSQPAPIYYVNQGQTTPQAPPLSSMFSDMEKYLDESREKGKLSESAYARLFRRLQDLRGKYDHQRAAGGGIVDASDEEVIRRDVAFLGGEISRAVKPAPIGK